MPDGTPIDVGSAGDHSGQVTDLSGPSTYPRLRSWYLARLRKKILQRIEKESLTPGGLIAADSAAVHDLVLSAGLGPQHSEKGMARKFTAALIPAGMAACISIALFAIPGSVPITALLLLAFAAVQVAVLLRLRKQLEGDNSQLIQALAEALKREQAIADYALDAICAFDAEGRFLSVSPSACELFGKPAAGLLGTRLVEHGINTEVDAIRSALESTVTSGAKKFDMTVRGAAGTLIDVLLTAEWSNSDQIVYAIARNITPQKNAERMRRDLVSMLGHDLKTPLTSLRCSLELVLEAPSFDESKPVLQRSLESIDRLMRLINQLLDLQKMEEGKIAIHLKQGDVRELLAQTISYVSSFARSKGINIELDCPRIITDFDGDRLAQVMVNLLSNAIKFSSDNSTILVHGYAGHQYVHVSVKDQGIGISADAHELIFERYRQLETEKKQAGTGLGLHICRGIVQAHGGAIGVESELGRGRKFWFTLPSSDCSKH